MAWGEDGEQTRTHVNHIARWGSVMMETGQGLTSWPEMVREDFQEEVVSFKDEERRVNPK